MKRLLAAGLLASIYYLAAAKTIRHLILPHLVLDREGKVTFSELGYEPKNRSSYEQLRHAIQQTLNHKTKP